MRQRRIVFGCLSVLAIATVADAQERPDFSGTWAAQADASDPAGVTPGPPMGLPENATTVRVQDGKTLTTDGPFVGMKEAVGGYFVLEADDLDAAIQLAARVPAARLGGAIEIRPCETYW